MSVDGRTERGALAHGIYLNPGEDRNVRSSPQGKGEQSQPGAHSDVCAIQNAALQNPQTGSSRPLDPAEPRLHITLFQLSRPILVLELYRAIKISLPVRLCSKSKKALTSGLAHHTASVCNR